MPYLVSAIVSTYKSERFIEGKMLDLLRQTLRDKLEIVVVNTASPENEEEVIRRYMADHANIVYLKTDGRESIYQAWNRGIRASSGRYLTNSNTDDRLKMDALETLAMELEESPEVALVYADHFITNLENMLFCNHIRSGYAMKPEYEVSIMLNGCHMGPGPMWRRAIHDEIGFFNEEYRSAGDYEFWCRVATKYEMKHVRKFLGLYYNNPQGFVNSNQKLSVNESLRIQKEYSEKLSSGKRDIKPDSYYLKKADRNKFVNICMVTYNRVEFTRLAIDSIMNHTVYPHVVTIVDNHSQDGTKEYLLDLKSKGIVKNLILLDRNIGVASAANLGWLLERDAEYYLKFDNDIVIEKDNWLSNMVKVIERNGRIGAIAYNFEAVSYKLSKKKGLKIRLKSKGNLGGACILIPRRTFERLGYWCEDYGIYGEEDADYGYRIKCCGLWNVYMEDENIGLHLPAGKAAKIDMNSFLAKDGREEFEYREYRQMKDELRKYNVILGEFRRNLEGYRSGRKPLYVDANLAKDFLCNHLCR